MIVVMNQKFWEKKVTKLVEWAEYIGIDGENYGLIDRSSKSLAIASKYSHMASLGSYTPDGRLYTMLRKLKKGEEVNENRFLNEVEIYLEDKAFISCVIKTLRALYSCGFDTHLNVFVILPNLVYKYLGGRIIDRMVELADVDFQFIFSQEEIKAFGYDKLEIPMKRSMLKQIANSVERLEKKYKIKYKDRDDRDDYE